MKNKEEKMMLKQVQFIFQFSEWDKGIGIGFSDPTPALPEREGARFETNKLLTVHETDSLPIGEGWGGVKVQ
ncbi:MAG: hypothetical protein NTY07_16885 [Bacteroidia bacterium]|nr:hypothetical protein [Bacteroidia bacterium]